ncbi:hypothetical protein R1sor_018737 [Riccia sorocarpa]|uniref:NPF family transporter n=1 Tax=Riccia sorocarpa TaxID=122646 RepID=A0ABD3IE97_9MARC
MPPEDGEDLRKTMKLNFAAVLRNKIARRRGKGNCDQDEDEITTRDGTVDRFGRRALRHHTGTWRGAGFVLVQQVCANLAFFTISVNIVVYLTAILHEHTAAAVKNVSNWTGASWFAPLIAGFIADSYLGRYWTGLLSCIIYILGLVTLTVSVSLESLRPPQCELKDFTCKHVTVGQGALFYSGLYVMVMGAGGVQGTALPFGADQFDEEDEKEKKQKSSFFNWFYQATFVGSLIATTFLVYMEENVSWGLAFGIACGVMTLGTCAFVFGVPFYRYHRPGGNPLTRIFQVLVAAFWKRGLTSTSVANLYETDHMIGSVVEGSRKLRHSSKLPFLDKAAIITRSEKEDPNPQSPWRLCTVTQVEESKSVLCVIPIFCTSIMYGACYNQLSTLFVTQGTTMDRSLGGSFQIPAASLSVFEALSVISWTVTYDLLLMPLLRKRTGNPRGISTLKRMGIGLVLSILSMTLAAGVEIVRLRTVKRHGLEDDTLTPVPISVLWLIPQYFVMGASEIFTYVGQLEFFYDQAPDAMRGVGAGLSMLTNGLGSFLASLLVTIVNDITKRDGNPGWIADNLNRGRIDLFFWLLVVLSTVNLLAFIVCAYRYEYSVKEPLSNKLPSAAEGHTLTVGNDRAEGEDSKQSTSVQTGDAIGVDSNFLPTHTVP